MKKLFFGCLLVIALCCPATARAQSAAQVAVSAGSLNVRAGAGTQHAVIGSLQKNGFVTVLSSSGAWHKVQFAPNKTGYAYASYLKPVSSVCKSVSTAGGRLNVRTGAGTGYPAVTALINGSDVLSLSSENGFDRILFNGSSLGYASSRYLVAKTGSQFPALALSVPDYKQTDSRWANLTVGASGQSMARIGCVTTCLAMTESVRLSGTVTPKQMLQRLQYTPGGAVYWPGEYDQSQSADYLKTIYDKLKSGVPVIVGSKKNNGGQHFVVVTG